MLVVATKRAGKCVVLASSYVPVARCIEEAGGVASSSCKRNEIIRIDAIGLRDICVCT